MKVSYIYRLFLGNYSFWRNNIIIFLPFRCEYRFSTLEITFENVNTAKGDYEALSRKTNYMTLWKKSNLKDSFIQLGRK